MLLLLMCVVFGVRFRLVWINIDGTGLAGVYSMYQGHLFFSKTPRCVVSGAAGFLVAHLAMSHVRPPERREVDAELLEAVEEAARQAPEARGGEVGCRCRDAGGFQHHLMGAGGREGLGGGSPKRP